MGQNHLRSCHLWDFVKPGGNSFSKKSFKERPDGKKSRGFEDNDQGEEGESGAPEVDAKGDREGVC